MWQKHRHVHVEARDTCMSRLEVLAPHELDLVKSQWHVLSQWHVPSWLGTCHWLLSLTWQDTSTYSLSNKYACWHTFQDLWRGLTPGPDKLTYSGIMSLGPSSKRLTQHCNRWTLGVLQCCCSMLPCAAVPYILWAFLIARRKAHQRCCSVRGISVMFVAECCNMS